MLYLKRNFSNSFSSAVFSIMGPSKKRSEDAFYTSPDVISIADGVGGWSLSGVDPSKYAWELMRNVELASKSLKPERTAFSILKSAASQCKEIGSSTCSLILLDNLTATIDTLNIGDSGFFIYRKFNNRLTIVDKSVEVLHGFNFPFQLGTEGDSVDTAWKKRFDVKNEDYVLMFTDGVSDNLFEENIRLIVEKELSDNAELDKVAKIVAETAFEYSRKNNYLSPFAKTANEKHGHRYIGGKPDDITVVFSKVNIG